jgi:tetratricopeptide (TPR) repeat protein
MHNDLDTATSFAEQSLVLSRQVGDEEYISGNLSNLGMLAHLRGDLAPATEFLEESLAISRRRGDLEGIMVTGANLGAIACELGNIDQAATRYREALVLANELGNAARIAEVVSSIATLAGKTGRPRAAAQLFAAVEALRSEIGVALPRFEQVDLEHEISTLRSQLGSAEFFASYDVGRNLQIGEVVAAALTLVEGPALAREHVNPLVEAGETP